MTSKASMTICFDVWTRDPVFHEWDRWDTERKAAVTKCGRVINHDSWRLTRLRRDHAQRIGRACQPCLNHGMTWVPRPTSSHQHWRPAA